MLRWLIGGAVVLVAGYFVMPYLSPSHALTGMAEQTSQFAADRAGPELAAVPFDSNRAMGYLKEICAIGPRISATPGMTKQQDLIRAHFEKLNLKVQAQPFTARQNSQKQSVNMTNLVVSVFPEKSRRIIICSHYDTRPIADQEPNPRKWTEPFLSANDGGSGVAFLMELANHLGKLKLQVGVDFVFFDGEEYVFQPRGDKYFFGSEHFATEWKKNKRQPDYVAAVLLDMVGGKNARFPVEAYSWERNADLCREIWRTAKEVGATAFKEEIGYQVQDDHLALIAAGIPAIDIIDFDYAHWHRLTDTPENCDPQALAQVAKVLTTWMQRLK